MKLSDKDCMTFQIREFTRCPKIEVQILYHLPFGHIDFSCGSLQGPKARGGKGEGEEFENVRANSWQ